MVVRRGLFCLAALVLGVACVKHGTETSARSFTDDEIRYAGYARSFQQAEPGILRTLTEKDSRLFARFAPRSGESPGWQSRAYESPLSFGDREGAISEAEELWIAVKFDGPDRKSVV